MELSDAELLERYDAIQDEYEKKLRLLFAEHGRRLHRLLVKHVNAGSRSPLRCVVPDEWARTWAASSQPEPVQDSVRSAA